MDARKWHSRRPSRTPDERTMRVERRPIRGSSLGEFRPMIDGIDVYGPFIQSGAMTPGSVASWAARGRIDLPDGVLAE